MICRGHELPHVQLGPSSQEEKGTTEDEVVGQCHGSDQHEIDPTLGGSGRQEGLACSGPWGH